MSFPRYERYKDSGIEWLSEVPEHWNTKPIKHQFRVVGGSTPKSDQKTFWDGDIIWVTPADLSKLLSLYISDSQRKITMEGLASCGTTLVPKSSIILSTRAPIGSLAIAKTDLCTNQGCKSLVPFGATDSDFYGYLLSICAGELNVRGKGTTFLELSGDELGAFKVPAPPAPEQREISAFLDRETAKIDALIAEQQRLIELLKEKRQAVISHAVTKGLNPDAPMKDSGIEWLGEVPEHWGISQSRRMFAVRSEPALATDKMLTASQKYGVLFQSDFVELEGRRVVEVIMGVESLKHVEPDDFIISMRSFQGGIEWCKLRGSTSFHYVMLRPVKHMYPPFFAHLFKSITYIQALRATTDLIRDGQELRYSNFTQVDLPIVPIEEQKQIAAYLDEKVEALDNLAKEATSAIALLQERRAAMISAAVTGKIDVRGLVASQADVEQAA